MIRNLFAVVGLGLVVAGIAGCHQLDNRHDTKDIDTLKGQVLDLQKEDVDQKARLAILEGKVNNLVKGQAALSLSLTDTQTVLDDYLAFKKETLTTFKSIEDFKNKVEAFKIEMLKRWTENYLEHTDFQDYIKELQEAIKSSNGNIEALKAQVSGIDAKYAALGAGLQKQIDANKVAIEGLQKMQNEFVKCFATSANSQVGASPVWCEKLHSTLRDYKDQLANLTAGQAANTSAIESLQAQVKTIFARLDDLDNAILDLNLQIQTIKNQINDVELVLVDLNKDVQKNAADIQAQNAKLEALKGSLTSLDKDLNTKINQSNKEAEFVFQTLVIAKYNHGSSFNFSPLVVTLYINNVVFNSIKDYHLYRSGVGYGTKEVWFERGSRAHALDKSFIIPDHSMTYTIYEEKAPAWITSLAPAIKSLITICENGNKGLCINAFNSWYK